MIELLIVVLVLALLISAIHERDNCVLKYEPIDLSNNATWEDFWAMCYKYQQETLALNAISKEFYDSLTLKHIPYIRWKEYYEGDWKERILLYSTWPDP